MTYSTEIKTRARELRAEGVGAGSIVEIIRIEYGVTCTEASVRNWTREVEEYKDKRHYPGPIRAEARRMYAAGRTAYSIAKSIATRTGRKISRQTVLDWVNKQADVEPA